MVNKLSKRKNCPHTHVFELVVPGLKYLKKDDNIDFKFQNSDKKPTKSITTISWLNYSK
jgi:hypothetical protein